MTAMSSLLRFLGLQEAPAGRRQAEPDAIREIVRGLDEMAPEEARYIASFAYILGRVAHADLKISEEETRAMEKVLVEHGELGEEQAIIAVQIAKSQNRLFGGTENYLVTRQFNKIASREQKLALLRCLFAVSSSDRSISVVEDNEIRNVSRELRLDHRDFIQVRSSFREHLAVLKERDVNSN